MELKEKKYCGGDYCSGLWNLLCDDPRHPKADQTDAYTYNLTPTGDNYE